MMMPGRTFQAGSDSYRYSMNGQEKSPEIAPNTNNAEFWQYDSRIGRRWNVDPKPIAGTSVYSAFVNNPNYFTDPLGDTTKFFGNDGLLLYQDNKGEGTSLYAVSREQFTSIRTKYKNSDKLTRELVKVGVRAYTTQDEAAAAWAPGGFAATKSDPNGFERGARIFHAKAFGDQKISDLYLIGSTVIGKKSTEPGVSQETDPSGSTVSLNGKDISTYTQEGIRTTRRGNVIVRQQKVIVQSWNASAMIHTHPPGNDNYSISVGNQLKGQAFSGDFAIAVSGISVYLVPTTPYTPYRMFRLDLSPDDRNLHFRNIREGQRYMRLEQKTIYLQ